MAQALDEELSGWRQRTLDKRYPYLVVDARYEHIRDDGRVESEGVLTVKGINHEGYREILGIAATPCRKVGESPYNSSAAPHWKSNSPGYPYELR